MPTEKSVITPRKENVYTPAKVVMSPWCDAAHEACCRASRMRGKIMKLSTSSANESLFKGGTQEHHALNAMCFRFTLHACVAGTLDNVRKKTVVVGKPSMVTTHTKGPAVECDRPIVCPPLARRMLVYLQDDHLAGGQQKEAEYDVVVGPSPLVLRNANTKHKHAGMQAHGRGARPA